MTAAVVSGGLPELARQAPQPQVLCGAGDLATIKASTGISVEAIRSGEQVMGLEVILVPGHTPGHSCLFDAITSTMLLSDVAGNTGSLQRAGSFTRTPLKPRQHCTLWLNVTLRMRSPPTGIR